MIERYAHAEACKTWPFSEGVTYPCILGEMGRYMLGRKLVIERQRTADGGVMCRVLLKEGVKINNKLYNTYVKL